MAKRTVRSKARGRRLFAGMTPMTRLNQAGQKLGGLYKSLPPEVRDAARKSAQESIRTRKIDIDELRRQAIDALGKNINQQTSPRPASDFLQEPQKSPRTRTRVGVQTKQPDKVAVGQDTLDPEDKTDVSMRSTTSVKRRIIGNVVGKMYKLKDRFEVPRSKWLREKMKTTVRTSIVVRDDMAVDERDTGNLNNDTRGRSFSVSGLNRKGVYRNQSLGLTRAIPNTTDYATQGYYIFSPLNPPTGLFMPYTAYFAAQDYNSVLFLQLMLQWITSAQLTGNQRNMTRVTFPMVRRRLISTITNRNAYTPVACTLYVLQRKHMRASLDLASGSTAADVLFGTAGTTLSNFGPLPPKYVYPITNQALLPGDGAGLPGPNFIVEQSIHMKASPFMSEDFVRMYDVKRVHKFILQPGDLMEYTLSVGMNGFPLSAITANREVFEDPGSVLSALQVRWANCLSGDYELLLTFHGAAKFTAAYKRFVSAGNVQFVNQLARSGVTGPAEISMQNKVVMDVLDDDYYDLRVPVGRRSVEWDGTRAAIDGIGFDAAGNSSIERRYALMDDLDIRKKREYPEEFNVASGDLVDPEAGTSSGYYIQVKSDVSYKTINTQSDPTP